MKSKQLSSNPPRLMAWLFNTIARSEEHQTVSGDMEELYIDLVEEKGQFKSILWYGWQILFACPAFFFNSIYWRIFMFFNYLKLTIRNIRKHKTYSFINIAGLAIGITCCLLIMLWVQDQLSYDRFHENAENLYAATFSNGSITTPSALSGFLKAEYPEVIQSSRYSRMGRNLLKFEENEIYEGGGIMVDPDFVKMFTVPFLGGDPETALGDPNSILISETFAKKLFRNKEPMGQTVTFGTAYDLKITAVFKDYPSNSHMQFEYIIPLGFAKNLNRNLNTWEYNDIQTYVQLQKGIPVQSVDEKISSVVESHRPQDKRPLSLQPILRLHLNPFNQSSRPITYVYMFSAMAFFILLIACINFINLTTARSSSRAKEVGIRKTVGAYRNNLIKQFFGESLFLTLIASLAGIGLSILFLPMFNKLTGKTLTWEFMLQQRFLFGIFGIILITVILGGSYPAFFLSRFQPVKVLSGKLRTGMKGSMFRKVLVVFQFSLSVFLILGTLMVYRQVHFLQERDVGYDRNNIITFGIGGRFAQNRDTIKAELLSNPNIKNITLVDVAPYRWNSNAGEGDVHWEGKTNQLVKMVMTRVDYDFLETFGLEMAQGRFFSNDYSTDVADAFVVNQAAVKAMEMDNPIGKEFKVWDLSGQIIGVVKDYNFESLHTEIIPLAMRIDPRYQQACIRIDSQNIEDTLGFIENKWKEIYPEYPFEYQFLDESLQNLYSSEQSTGKIISVFTILALFISCLGIFGLSLYTAEQRTKEIGIKKVLGASAASVVKDMSKEFVILVLIANIIVWPLAYILLNKWLQTFAYQVQIGWPIFVLTGLAVFVISLLTVSWQILRAAMANPVDSLRYE
ncbi:MAG: ABC transporter permease [Candidatus Aminicenantes bacterium]|nr:ABC transporter permease [Candidatus Aminicenantes bacterium]